MRNLISMDFYRLKKSKLFIGSLIAILVMSFGFIFAEVALTNSIASFTGEAFIPAGVTFSSILESAFPISIFREAMLRILSGRQSARPTSSFQSSLSS